MSSCFLCDCSCRFTDSDRYHFLKPSPSGGYVEVLKYMKQLPIMVGSSGTERNDQQHNNNSLQNYISYRVKKIELRGSVVTASRIRSTVDVPDYVLIFKVPFRTPLVSRNFQQLDRFILYSEPENVLDYKALPLISNYTFKGQNNEFKIGINKPFILGPNEYLGVFYMVEPPLVTEVTRVEASARVWFDMA